MRKLPFVLALLHAAVPAASAQPAQLERPLTLAEKCGALPVEDACNLITEAAAMLRPSYGKPKETNGVAGFQALGYGAEYIEADTTLHRPSTDVFLVARPGTRRLFVVITGTEDWMDWISNARFTPYTGTYEDGQFYAPPGHGGFRGGVVDMVGEGILRQNEFDAAALDCASGAARRSRLAAFICDARLRLDQGPIETIIVGHSRGAGIGVLAASAFAGLEVVRPDPRGPVRVERQRHWPLKLHAVIGFAPPYAVSRLSDAEAGLPVPPGLPPHEEILRQHGIPDRTILFINDRDIVPSLSTGQARHRGHLFRIRRDRRVVYEGDGWGPDRGLFEAHSSGGYCADVLTELNRPLQCEPRRDVDQP